MLGDPYLPILRQIVQNQYINNNEEKIKILVERFFLGVCYGGLQKCCENQIKRATRTQHTNHMPATPNTLTFAFYIKTNPSIAASSNSGSFSI